MIDYEYLSKKGVAVKWGNTIYSTPDELRTVNRLSKYRPVTEYAKGRYPEAFVPEKVVVTLFGRNYSSMVAYLYVIDGEPGIFTPESYFRFCKELGKSPSEIGSPIFDLGDPLVVEAIRMQRIFL